MGFIFNNTAKSQVMLTCQRELRLQAALIPKRGA